MCVCFLTAADEWGRLFVGGASLVGIGSLCYYGLGMAKEEGAIDRARCVCVCVHACTCVCVRALVRVCVLVYQARPLS